MKVFFGKVEEEFDDGGYYEVDDVPYEFVFDVVDRDIIKLSDVCERTIPFSPDQIPDMINALVVLRHYFEQLEAAEKALEKVLDPDEIRTV